MRLLKWKRNKSKPANPPLRWHDLTHLSGLDDLIARSFEQPGVIFKHSTRCGTSLMAKKRLEREWPFPPEEPPAWFLDLLPFREISDAIAGRLDVPHQSPQLLLVKNGRCVYHASHGAITAEALKEALEACPACPAPIEVLSLS